MATPIDLYVHPGIAIKFEVLTKVTMTPLTAADVIPPGAITVPPQAPASPAAAIMANLQDAAVVAAQAAAQEAQQAAAAYLAAAPVYSVTPTGQTSGPK